MERMKRRTAAAKKRRGKAKAKRVLSVAETISQADEALDALDIPKAVSLYNTAVKLLQTKLATSHDEGTAMELVRVLEKLGETEVSLSEQDKAIGHFSAALQLIHENDSTNDLEKKIELHERRASLCLYLGQLNVEEDAFEMYKKGVVELEAAISTAEKIQNTDQKVIPANATAEDPANELRRQLCKAHCAIAELFLTDLCFVENAEETCEHHTQTAMTIRDGNSDKPLVDALQTLGSLRLSQNRGLEAVEPVLEAYDRMKTGCEALANLVGFGEPATDESLRAVELEEVEEANNLPGFEFRCQTAKLLLECAAALSAEASNDDTLSERCIKSAIRVLGSLMAENDEVVEIWYLLGCAFASTDDGDEMAIHYLNQAQEMLLQVRQSMESGGMMDDENEELYDQKEEVLSQLGKVQAKLQTLQGDEDDDDMMES